MLVDARLEKCERDGAVVLLIVFFQKKIFLFLSSLSLSLNPPSLLILYIFPPLFVGAILHT